jgi:hypothetical protein
MAAGEAPTLESEIDALYQAPLDAFTAARNALAATLRAAKRRDEAEQVKALAKPGATAWAVNQVWWRDPAALDELLEAGKAEREAQAARARGRAVDVRAAAARRERAVAAVVEAAVRMLGKPGGAADTRFRVAGTVEALASSGLPHDVAPGRLTRDLQSTGLEALGAASGALGPAPPDPPGRPVAVPSPAAAGPAASPTPAAPRASERRQAERLADLTARLQSQQAIVETSTREASALNASLEEARAGAEKAAARAVQLEEQLDAARTALGEARRTFNDAMRAASEADMRRARAARELNKLQDEIDALDTRRTPR